MFKVSSANSGFCLSAGWPRSSGRLGHPVDRDAAFEAWIQGYSTAEYAERAEVSLNPPAGALR